MEIIARKDAAYVLRLNSGEELINALEEFVLKNGIRGAWFWAIGAADEVEIAFYDIKKRKYITKRIKSRLEIVSIVGNIARKDKDVIVHAHGAFSRPDYRVIGGHIFSCRISATCEIHIKKLSALRRKPDPTTALHLLLSG